VSAASCSTAAEDEADGFAAETTCQAMKVTFERGHVGIDWCLSHFSARVLLQFCLDDFDPQLDTVTEPPSWDMMLWGRRRHRHLHMVVAAVDPQPVAQPFSG
jgi:hypothetical protein